eukprot:4024009-Pyramimonas_sp.AAC.2
MQFSRRRFDIASQTAAQPAHTTPPCGVLRLVDYFCAVRLFARCSCKRGTGPTAWAQHSEALVVRFRRSMLQTRGAVSARCPEVDAILAEEDLRRTAYKLNWRD